MARYNDHKTRRKVADTLHDARVDYAMAGGDGFGSYDWLGAKYLIDEGCQIAGESMAVPADERDDWIEERISEHPEREWYLLSSAVFHQLREIRVRDERAAA